jgi:hypothetical protein
VFISQALLLLLVPVHCCLECTWWCDSHHLRCLATLQQMAGLVPQKLQTLRAQVPPPLTVQLLLLQLCQVHFRLPTGPSRARNIACHS